jgi:hypothetical protein
MNREIERAIFKRTGIEGVRVSAMGGLCRFYSDTNNSIDFGELDSVYVCHMNHMTAKEWSEEFKALLKALESEQ